MKYKHKPKTNEDAAFSSRISPWLANGSLSVRKVYHETRKFEE
jgi:deoxyribodipyrimidine photolyase